MGASEVTVECNTWDQDEIFDDLSPNCDIAGLREAIKTLDRGTGKYHLFCGEINLDDLPDDTKLADHGFNDITVEYPDAGAVSDIFDPPHPVIISSDQMRSIILPQRGIHKNAKIFEEKIITRNNSKEKTQLTSSGNKGKYMILYIEDPRKERKEGKHFVLKYYLPRSTRQIFIESNPPVDLNDAEIEAPEDSTFNLKIFQKEDWTTNYEDPQSDVKTIEFGDGKSRIFVEGSKMANVLAAASLGAAVGGVVGTAVGTPVAGPISAAAGAIAFGIGAAILPK